MISRGATSEEVAAAARAAGFRSMWADGLGKVREGVTSLREMARAVQRDFDTAPA